MPTQKQDDVLLLGPWTVTLQENTPLHFLKTESLDQYLLKVTVDTAIEEYKGPAPGETSAGICFHSKEADPATTDGVCLWVEVDHKKGTKKYCLAGADLESQPVVTTEYDIAPGNPPEDWEILVQGHIGCIFVRDRKVRIKFRSRASSGHIAFFNSSKSRREDISLDCNFSNACLTYIENSMANLKIGQVPSTTLTQRPRLGDLSKRNISAPGNEIKLRSHDHRLKKGKVVKSKVDKISDSKKFAMLEQRILLTEEAIDGCKKRLQGIPAKEREGHPLQKKLDELDTELANFHEAKRFY